MKGGTCRRIAGVIATVLCMSVPATLSAQGRPVAVAGQIGTFAVGAAAGQEPAHAREGVAPNLTSSAARQALLGLPLRFESNAGQTHEDVLFVARGGRSSLFLTRAEAMLALLPAGGNRSGAVRLSFANANPDPLVTPEAALPGLTEDSVLKQSA